MSDQPDVNCQTPADAIAECQRIQALLRSATDAATVHAIADVERETVQRFAADEKTKPLAHIISNLKAYMLTVELPANAKRRNS